MMNSTSSMVRVWSSELGGGVGFDERGQGMTNVALIDVPDASALESVACPVTLEGDGL